MLDSKSRTLPLARSVISPYCFALLLVIIGGLGCGSEGPLTQVSFRLIGAPTAVPGGCLEDSEPIRPQLGQPGPTRLRLTYRAAAGGPLSCDVLIDLTSDEDTVIAIPEPAGNVDIFAELYRPDSAAPADWQLAGVGTVRDTDLAAGGMVDIRVRPANGFSCALGRARGPRAFHAAALLPTGEVMLIGGVVGDATVPESPVDLATGLFLVQTLEIYDPADGTFRSMAVPGLLPRAFHRAYVLDSEGPPYRIAVVGGITVAGDPTTTPALVADPTGLFRWMPASGARGARTELLTYDPETSTVTRTVVDDVLTAADRRMMAAVAVGPSAGAVIVGGWPETMTSDPPLTFSVYPPASAKIVDQGALQEPRVGATATDLGGGEVLVWGGQIGPMITATPGEHITDVGSTTATSQPLAPPGATARVWHAAAVGDAGVIIAGGFGIVGTQARDPDARPLQRIQLSPTPSVRTLAGGIQAGYPAAVRLAGGDVLVAGGNPAQGSGGCSSAAGGVVCATRAAVRVGAGDGEPVSPLVMPRYGHRMTRLDGGWVLVTGGLHADASGLRALTDAEIFDATTVADDPLADLAPSITRAPAELARLPGGGLASACTIIETDAPAQ